MQNLRTYRKGREPLFYAAIALMTLVALAGFESGCGGHSASSGSSGSSGSSPTLPPVTVTPTPVPADQPTFSHVILVMEENHSYNEVIGNAAMPYFNSLASQYG